METGEPLSPEPRLEPGTLVEITSGVLTGTRGTIIKLGRRNKFIVEVQFLRQGVSLEIDGQMVEPVNEESKAVRTSCA
jgi:transcription antitermination factor NusG